jgi:hypothetical protein
MRSGVFNAVLPLPHPVVVEEDNVTRKQKKICSADVVADADANASTHDDSLDFHHLDMVVGLQSQGAWSRGAESVIGTMNRTAAAFASEKHDYGPVFQVESDAAEGGAELEGRVVQSAAGKLGVKWKEKVFRYKGEADGAGSDVLDQLLQRNPLHSQQPAIEGSKGSNQQKVEDLLKGMSRRFVAAMQSVAEARLDDMNVDHVIGPFKNDLHRAAELVQEAADTNHRMQRDAEELDVLYQKVSESRRCGGVVVMVHRAGASKCQTERASRGDKKRE